ncbi:MAG: septation protein A [Magnetococcales bacterium]|nr:septation protein A [Magnetococcales bacterium]
MALLKDFLPVVLFFVVYKTTDIYTATAVLIATVALQSLYLWFRHGRVPPAQLLTLVLLVLFGGATLLFRDPLFIQWKPTLLQWIMAGVFLGSHFLGDQVIIKRLMGRQMEMPDSIWNRLNLAWVLFFLVSGGLNLYVAKNFNENTWVNFKLFGLMGLMFLFILAQGLLLSRYFKEPAKAQEKNGHGGGGD